MEIHAYVKRLVQNKRNSSADAFELRLFWANLLIYGLCSPFSSTLSALKQ